MDLVFTQAAAPALSLWRNVAGTSFEQVALPPTTLSSGAGLAVIDYDNDGWLDIVATGIGAQNPSGDLSSCETFRAASKMRRRPSRRRRRPRSSSRAPWSRAISTTTTTPIWSSPMPADHPFCFATMAATRTKRYAWRSPASTTTAAASAPRSKCRPGAVWQKLETVAASGFLEPELAGTPRRHRQTPPGRRRPAAVADRRGAGRSGARRRTAPRDHPDRSTRQLVSNPVHVERREVRVRVGQHRSGRDRALDCSWSIRAA